MTCSIAVRSKLIALTSGSGVGSKTNRVIQPRAGIRKFARRSSEPLRDWLPLLFDSQAWNQAPINQTKSPKDAAWNRSLVLARKLRLGFDMLRPRDPIQSTR